MGFHCPHDEQQCEYPRCVGRDTGCPTRMPEPASSPLDAAWTMIRALHSDPEGCRTFDQYALGVYDALRVIADLGGGPTKEPEPEAPEAPPTAQVIDLMEALKASLKQHGRR